MGGMPMFLHRLNLDHHGTTPGFEYRTVINARTTFLAT